MRVLRDLGWYIRRNASAYLLGVATLVLADLTSLVPPRVAGVIVDAITGHRLTPTALALWLALLLATALFGYGVRYIWRVLLQGAAFRLSVELRDRLFAQFSRMSPRFYEERRVGDLMAHATNDVQAVEAAMNDGVLLMIDSVVMGGLTLVAMALISWPLTLVSLVALPFMALAMQRFGRAVHDRFEEAQAAFSDLNDRVHENLTGMRVMKAFGQEEAEKRTFAQLSEEVVRKNVRVAQIDALFEPTIQAIVGLAFLLAVGVGAWFVVRGALTFGGLTAFAMYLGELIWPMMAFGFLFNVMQRGSASYDRIRELLTIAPDVPEDPNPIADPPAGDLRISVGRFAYPGADRPALRDVEILVPRGATLGVVGRVGQGKSTLLRLLVREFDVDEREGGVWIGGVPIRRLALATLRRTVAYVAQEPFLFSATLAENVAFGRPGAGRAEIERAVALAALDEDVARFPRGYDTLVGERGVTLSGGQKQRIALARALLLDAEVLVLDDALSAVDGRTESRILANLRENRAGRTTVISAHRMTAVEHADEIVVFEDGAIRERGRHEELLLAGGWYARMYRRQRLEAIVEEGGEPA